MLLVLKKLNFNISHIQEDYNEIDFVLSNWLSSLIK